MGYPSRQINDQFEAQFREQNGDANAQQPPQRMGLADKIVMVVVDRIVADLIRPGPKPEERECYEVAQELREMVPVLCELVKQVLAVEQR